MRNIAGALLIISFFSMSNVYAGAIQTESLREQVIVEAKWGSKNGEIGNVPINTENQTAGESINPIALDKDGNIYIGDSVNSRILKFTSKGKYIFEFKLSHKFHLIEDILIDQNNRVYSLIEQDKPSIVISQPSGTDDTVIDISNIGQLEKNKDGVMEVNKKKSFVRGVQDRLLMNADGTLLVQGSDLIKINNKGDVLNRVGPYIDSAFVDSSGMVFVLSVYEKSGEPDQYDKNLKYIGSGWGKYKDVLWPEKSDSLGNVYGFMLNGKQQDNNLRKYNVKKSEMNSLPIAREKLELEHWAVDSKGNIYYTESMGTSFKVIKVTPIQQKR